MDLALFETVWFTGGLWEWMKQLSALHRADNKTFAFGDIEEADPRKLQKKVKMKQQTNKRPRSAP